MLPFTPDEFFDVFGAYNDAIWPLQIVAYGFGLVATAALFRPSASGDRIIAGILACMWIWTGFAYHWFFFSAVNQAAFLFGVAFLVQGATLLYAGVAQRQLQFRYRRGAGAMVGIAFIGYAAIVYPLLGLACGHSYPRMPWFGLTPCPVTIFTLGFLLLSRACPWWLIAIPVLWSLVGGTAAFLLHVPEDWVLLLSGAISVVLLAAPRSPRPR
jgi:Family of unknown function (DUF6064)